VRILVISNRSLNNNEKILFKENPINGRATIKLAIKAMFEEKIRYQNNGEDGTDSDAFLHAFWSALLAKDISIDWAQRWTTAHEEDFNSVYTQMDLFNNSIGIDFVRGNQLLTNDQLANSIEDLVDLGKAKKILDGKLINSTKENKKNLNIFESIFEKALSLISKLIATSSASRNKDGMTPLIFASNLGEIEALKLIVEYSDTEAVDDYGETAIFHAARIKTTDIGMFLLNNKANPNAVNLKNGNTALMEAVQYKNIELAKSLIKFGANLNLKDHCGFSAYDIALQEEVENEFSFLKPS